MNCNEKIRVKIGIVVLAAVATAVFVLESGNDKTLRSEPNLHAARLAQKRHVVSKAVPDRSATSATHRAIDFDLFSSRLKDGVPGDVIWAEIKLMMDDRKVGLLQLRRWFDSMGNVEAELLLSSLELKNFDAKKGDYLAMFLMAKVGESNFQLLRQWLSSNEMSDRVRVNGAQIVAKILCRKSPSDALSYASSLPIGALQDAAFAGLIAEWATSSPNEALDYVARWPEGRIRAFGFQSVAAALVGADIDSARTRYEETEHGEFRDVLGRVLAKAIIDRNVDSTVNILNKMSDPAREEIQPDIFQKWVRRDSQGNLNFVLSISEIDQRNRAINQLFTAWSSHDVDAAAKAIGTIDFGGNDEVEFNCNYELIRGLAKKSPEELKSWLKQLEDGSAKDRLVEAAAGRSELELDQRLAIAMDISIESQREQVLARLLADEMKSKNVDANSILKGLGLSSRERESLLRRLKTK